MIRLLILLAGALAAAVTPTVVLADRRELYLTVAFVPGAGVYENPLVDQGSSNQVGFGGEVAAYYGITNTLHLGAVLRASTMRDSKFSNVSTTVPSLGWRTGTVYANDFAMGVGGLALYRFDTRHALAPLLSIELGLTRHEYSQIGFVPEGEAFSVPFEATSEVRFSARAGLALEYRVSNHLVASGGVVYTMEPGGLAPRSFSIPLRIGYIWH